LEREKQAKPLTHHSAWQALRQPTVIMLVIAYFGMNMSIYGVNFWLPTIVKKLSGFSDLVVTLVTALPYCVGLIAILLIGWSSDRTRERRWHTALPMLALSLGLGLSVLVQDSIPLTISMFSIAAVGMYGYIPCFWSLPTSLLSGTAAAACIGLINSIGNLGGYFGPRIVGKLVTTTHSFVSGILFLSLSALIAAVLVLSIRLTKERTQVTVEVPA
jgi:sugar phosphate permease